MLKSRLPIIIAGIASVMIALVSYRFTVLDIKLAYPEMVAQIDHNRIAFLTHISFAPLALALGAYQMFRRQRGPRGARHRWVGRMYALAIVISGVAGFFVALQAAGGIVAATGFAALSVAWVCATLIAVWHAIGGRTVAHRQWMIYSFAMTFAGVTLRIYLGGFMAVGFTYTEASVYLAWICWIPNLMIAHWWLVRGKAT